MTEPRAVVLVPRRSGQRDRDRLWAWCRAWWERELPELPIVEGHHDRGLFNRSAAVNAAAKAAGDWDVAVLIDADVICDPARVREAIEVAREQPDRLVMPFDVRYNLDRPGSARIMAGDKGSWLPYIAKTYTDVCSSCVMIPRALWDAVGGFDELFEGWGFEDSAFANACETFGTTIFKIPGELWHLYHATAPEGRRVAPSFQKNRTRAAMYHAALGDRQATRVLIDGGSVSRPPRMLIPRILHRVVPAVSPPEAEAWWARFAELHPGWELMTHRDPLDPAEWPLTARFWRHCTSGAQLAGLVRLEALLRWGGIYVDQDVEPFRSFESLLGVPAFAAWEDARVVPDAVIGAEPGHPAIRACLDMALKRVSRGPWESGPGVTTAVLPGRDDVLLLPPGSLYDVHYRDPDRDHKMTGAPEPWTFARHHYWGSWLAREKTA